MGTNVIVFLSMIVMLGFGFFVGLWIGTGVHLKDSKKKKKRKNHSVMEECPHNIAEIKALDNVGIGETTVLVCCDCGEHLFEQIKQGPEL